jgi:hypothetical protein
MSEHIGRFHIGRPLALTVFTIFVSGSFGLAHAQQAGPTTLASAQPGASNTENLFRSIGRNELEAIQFCRDSLVFILAMHQLGPYLPTPDSEDNAKETIKRLPVSGYYYRILTRQGRHAPGGAKNYIVNRRMRGGFALVAYPVEYRSSGVMTFIVNLDGIVYQKDLGPKTPDWAKDMTEYDPDATWKKVVEGSQASAELPHLH